MYGPILFELEPAALLECAEVAVCLRSASGAGFDWAAEALSVPRRGRDALLQPERAMGTPC
jgi:hypothetical protein